MYKKLTNQFKMTFVFIIVMGMSLQVYGQVFNRRGTRGGAPGNRSTASWIAVPDEPAEDYGLYYFRKKITLQEQPSQFIVNVSADNRYKLYVNEELVSEGPALGDIQHWNYEIVDLAPYLKSGDNIISAKVWNEGNLKAVSQFSYRTGFFLQGTNEQTQVLSTNDTWKCIRDNSYTPIRQSVRGYYAAGAGDSIDMQYQVKDWEKLSLDDGTWKQAQSIFGNTSNRRGGRGGGGGSNAWNLVPSILPQMELTPQRLLSMRRVEGVSVPSSFPAEKASFSIPANTTTSILLDQTFYTNAYPALIFSGGENSNITITYAEGLYGENGAKNNRNEIEGKTISGRQDIIVSDGTDNQNFTALNWRTYRYVELKVVTKETPLIIEDFYGTFTGYPFKLNAKLNTDNAEIDKIMEIGWRTARSCAVETYMDCPYYERLQYIGDARIQLFVSYFNSGDDRLAKNALNLMGYSRQRDGYTLSRYPDTQNQVIPTYSLWYISMLYDYMMYGADDSFLKDKLMGSRQIMNYFLSHQDADGSLKNVPGWNFTDWASGWGRGTGPAGEDGSSALMDLQLLLALQSAKELEQFVGSVSFAAFYGNVADKLAQTIKSKYWDGSRNLFADTPEKDRFSQHTNSMAILAGLVEGQQAEEIGNLMLSDASLTQATIYFKYYLHLALAEAGLGDGYLDWLDIWRRYMEFGLTTWGETSEVETTRSDCHAWGSSPNVEFFRILLGIESDAPYFEKVKIKPHLGSIKKISGEMPHPKGKIAVSYIQEGSNWNIEISLPDETTGTFYWQGNSHALQGGLNIFKL
ncbi:alpha-L-rhamnosidase C-terminal domain-containing protein [Planctomycetota bacterium]